MLVRQYNLNAEIINRTRIHCPWAFLLLPLNLCTRLNPLGTGVTAEETTDRDQLVRNSLLTAIPRRPDAHLPLSLDQMEAELV